MRDDDTSIWHSIYGRLATLGGTSAKSLPMLSIHEADGKQTAIPYSRINRITYHPTDYVAQNPNDDYLTIHTGSTEVLVEGWNLHHIYNKLLDHTLPIIRMTTGKHRAKEREGLIIINIRVSIVSADD